MAVAAPVAAPSFWRPSLIDGYVLRTLFMPAVAVLGVTLVAFLLELTLRLINELSANGARLGFLFGLVASQIPYQLGLALPASFFVAMFIVMSRLDEDSEIDAILAGGVSFERIAAPLIFVGVLLGIISFLLAGYLQPYARFGYRAVKNAALEAGWTAQLDPQVFINAGPDFTITADDVDATGRSLRGVFIRRKSPDGEQIVTATAGMLGLTPDGKTTELSLSGGAVYADGPGGRGRLLRFGDFSDREMLGGKQALKPRGGDERELTVPELVREMDRPDAMIPKRTLQAELYVRLARALAVPFLPFLAMPLAMAAKRGRRAPGIILGGAVLIAFHHGVQLAKSFAVTGAVSPLLAIGGIYVAMVTFAIWLFVSSRTRPGETPISRLFMSIDAWIDKRTKVKPQAMQKRGSMSITGYLARILTVRTFAAAAALVALFQLIDLLERTSDILARGGVGEIFHYAALRLPGMFQQSAGFAVLAGTLFTFSQLARTSELVVMRSAGLSLYQIFQRTLPVAVAVSVIYILVADQVTPRAEQALSQWWTSSAPAGGKAAPQPKWFRIGDDVVVAKSAAADGANLTGVSIYERDAAKTLKRRLMAASATPEPGGWRLHDAVVTEVNGDRTTSRGFADYDWRTSLKPGEAARLFSDAYQITSGTALRSLFGKGPVTRSPSEFQTRLHRTLAGGAAPIIMLLLALPAALGHTRSNRTWPVIFGLGAGLLYLVVDGMLTALGQTGVLPPPLAAWGAPVAFACGAITVLLYAEA
jgi:lipopolysaccharide export system permease protein